MARRSARRSTRKSPARSAGRSAAAAPASDRDKIIAAFLDLLAAKPIEQIGFAELAEAAGVPLAQLRNEFPSTLAILAAHIKSLDRAVLSEDFSDDFKSRADFRAAKTHQAEAESAGGAGPGLIAKITSEIGGDHTMAGVDQPAHRLGSDQPKTPRDKNFLGHVFLS